jgi:hypothetical protein
LKAGLPKGALVGGFLPVDGLWMIDSLAVDEAKALACCTLPDGR